MQGLSSEQIGRFEQDGFLIENGLFDAAEIEALKDALQAPPDQKWLEAQHTVHALEITLRHPLFLQLAQDERIVARLRGLIGEDIQLQHSKLAAQPATPSKGGFDWHQDFAFFPHTNTDLVAVMVMLDDATPDNGCMRMVRGSHKRGLLDHSNEAGMFSSQCQEPVWNQAPDHITDITPKSGGISIHHCLMVHGSGPNHTGAPRRGIVFQYRADDAFQMADGIWRDTGLMVSGKRRELARCESAVFRLPKSRRYPYHPFGHAWHQQGDFAEAENAAKGVTF